MQEPRVFLRQKWSRYLGELRPIHDIYVGNEIFPSPTPSVTPQVSQTSTPSNTPTLTPTNTQTQTNTPSSTIGTTPSNTPSVTATPSVTPSITPNPICPEEFVVTNSTSVLFDNGTYLRQYSASGQSMNYGYALWSSASVTATTKQVILGTAPDGNNYAIFELFDGADYNTVIARFVTGSTILNNWVSTEQFPSILSSGSTWIGAAQSLTTSSTIFDGVRYPIAGQVSGGYITYPIICPTSTPTPSNTSTPTLTPTNTMTPTNTTTPNPVCPNQLTVSNYTGSSGGNEFSAFNGTYIYETIGFLNTVTNTFSGGTAPNGYDYIVYKKVSDNKYIYLQYNPNNGNTTWIIGIDYNPPGFAILMQQTSILISPFGYPKSGPTYTNSGYLTYPSVCPTSTPTNTTTPSVTPSNTSTPQVSQTMTPSISPTTTNTPSVSPTNTPSSTPPSCLATITVDNNATAVDITGVSVNLTPVTYVSGDNFSVLPGEFGTFSTSITGVSVTLLIDYSSHTGDKAINVLDCDGNSFCLDTLNTAGGQWELEGAAIDCSCTLTIEINNGDCV